MDDFSPCSSPVECDTSLSLIYSQLKLLRISQEFPEIESSTNENLLHLSIEVKGFVIRSDSCYDVIDICGLEQALNRIGMRVQMLLQVILDRRVEQKRA